MRKSVDLLSLKSFEGPSSKPYLSFEDNLSAMATPIYNTENSIAPGFSEGFVDPQFAYFKIGAFLVLELSLASLIIVVVISLLQARKRG